MISDVEIQGRLDRIPSEIKSREEARLILPELVQISDLLGAYFRRIAYEAANRVLALTRLTFLRHVLVWGKRELRVLTS